jgi:hypothetical protein
MPVVNAGEVWIIDCRVIDLPPWFHPFGSPGNSRRSCSVKPYYVVKRDFPFIERVMGCKTKRFNGRDAALRRPDGAALRPPGQKRPPAGFFPRPAKRIE